MKVDQIKLLRVSKITLRKLADLELAKAGKKEISPVEHNGHDKAFRHSGINQYCPPQSRRRSPGSSDDSERLLACGVQQDNVFAIFPCSLHGGTLWRVECHLSLSFLPSSWRGLFLLSRL